MRNIPHWSGASTLTVAESKSGVLVTTHPEENLVKTASLRSAPELLQKYYASSRFQGKTTEDIEAAKSGLGHYSDLQSLNSEDAVTWSFFGNLAYSSPSDRLATFNHVLERFGLSGVDDSPMCWLWRRLPHPEKPESSGGPEIDFGFLSTSTLLLGEAKWNSALGIGQGVDGNRSQLYLRAKYCDVQARKALRSVSRFIVLGIGRSANVFDGTDADLDTEADIRQLSWSEMAECFPPGLAGELAAYLLWKSQYSGRAP
jgi:hypothetical protein